MDVTGAAPMKAMKVKKSKKEKKDKKDKSMKKDKKEKRAAVTMNGNGTVEGMFLGFFFYFLPRTLFTIHFSDSPRKRTKVESVETEDVPRRIRTRSFDAAEKKADAPDEVCCFLYCSCNFTHFHDSQNGNPSVKNFGLQASVVAGLLGRGVTHLFPIQTQTFKPASSGKDLIGRARTGMGKTLAFILPILHQFLSKREFHVFA